jgi:hypothetical protein
MPLVAQHLEGGSDYTEVRMAMALDDDLNGMSRDDLVAELQRLREGIRAHRDSTGHELCWQRPQLWSLLPEPLSAEIAIPPWPQFLRGCVRCRGALERELSNALSFDKEFE